MIQVTIVSDYDSWINSHIPQMIKFLSQKDYDIIWIHQVSKIVEGDIVFYLGCGQIVPFIILQRNRHNLVVHESALPQGKGWSPLTWQILEGKNQIPITLFEAVEAVDSGMIYLQDTLYFDGTELIEELRQAQAEASIQLCLEFLQRYPDIIRQGRVQQGEATFYRRRCPEDSRLDPDQTLREQFNLLRVTDNQRYPAFFDLNGVRYILKIEKQ